MKSDTKQALTELFNAYDAATEQQRTSRAAAASQAAVLEEERKNALENVLRPALEDLAHEIMQKEHGAEISETDAGEIAFRFTPRHSIGSKQASGSLPKITFTYSAKDRAVLSRLSGNGVLERDGPRIPQRELTREKVEGAVLDLLRQVLPRGGYW